MGGKVTLRICIIGERRILADECTDFLFLGRSVVAIFSAFRFQRMHLKHHIDFTDLKNGRQMILKYPG